jgi:hypothetical protein
VPVLFPYFGWRHESSVQISSRPGRCSGARQEETCCVAQLKSAAATFKLTLSISAPGQTFRELTVRRDLYLGEGPRFFECVWSNFKPLVQALSMVGPFEFLIYPRQSRF